MKRIKLKINSKQYDDIASIDSGAIPLARVVSYGRSLDDGVFVDGYVNLELSTNQRKETEPTRTEYVQVAYDSAWKAAKDQEERKLELWRKSDLNEAIKGNNWKAIQSPSEAAQYHFDLYLKVEKVVDERQEFVDELRNIQMEMGDCHLFEFYDAIYDSGKFKLARANGEID